VKRTGRVKREPPADIAAFRCEPRDPNQIENNSHKDQRPFRLPEKNRHGTEQAGGKNTPRAEATHKDSRHCQGSEGAEPLVGEIESAVEVKDEEQQGGEPHTRTAEDFSGDFVMTRENASPSR
jgi:hypothetical protein